MSSPNCRDSCLNSGKIKVSSISECNEWRSTNADDDENIYSVCSALLRAELDDQDHLFLQFLLLEKKTLYKSILKIYKT